MDEMTMFNIRLTEDEKRKLLAIATRERRSMSGQILFWIDQAYRIVEVTELPHPADAPAVPLVTIAPQEELK